MYKNELIKESDSLIKFVTTLSIFFITVIDTLFKYANVDSQVTNENKMRWLIPAGILMLCILLFTILKNKIPLLLLKIIKALLLLEIFFYAVPVLIIGTNLNHITSYINYYSLMVFIWGLMILPIIIIGIMLFSLFTKGNSQ